MKLTEAQQDILQRMQRKPDEIHTADELQAQVSTMDALQRKGLVSGAFGATAMFGARRGRMWKLTAKGKEAQ